MTQVQVIPKKGECAVIDANVLITSSINKHYKKQCLQMIQDLQTQGVTLLVPRVVEYELLKRSENIKEFDLTLDYIKKRFARMEQSESIEKTACALVALYKWNKNTKEWLTDREKTGGIFNDMLVASTAMHYQQNHNVNTYILSSDHDFQPPYFVPVRPFCFIHPQGHQTFHFYLYRPETDVIIGQWKQYKSTLKVSLAL